MDLFATTGLCYLQPGHKLRCMYPSQIIKIITGIGAWGFLLLHSLAAHGLPAANVNADDNSFIELTTALYYLLDPQQQFDAQSIQQLPDSDFTRQTRFHLPATHGQRIWYRFSLHNPSAQRLQRLLDLNTLLINRAELFYQQDGKLQHKVAGLDTGSQQDSVTSPNIAFSIALDADQTQTFHLLLESNYNPRFQPRISDMLALKNYHQEQIALGNLICGILLGGIIYLLLISWLIKERSENIYFILFILSSLGVLASYHLDTQTIFSISPENFPLVLILQQSLNGVLFITFYRRFFPVKETCDNSYNILTAMLIGYIAIPIYSVLVDFHYTHSIISGLTHTLLLLMFILTSIFWKRKHPYAGYYAVTLSSFALIKLLHYLGNIGVFPLWSFTQFYYGISNCIIVFVFAITLAHRVNEVKEEQLKTAADASKAVASSQAKSEFLAKMSHEIRTPMNGVLGMVQLLKETPLSNAQQSYIQVVEQSGETLLKVINDILDYSKVEAGKMQLENTLFNMENLLGSISALFLERSMEKDVELVSTIHIDVSPNYYGDPTRITQILVNLLSNAFKFTEHGEITLSVEKILTTASGNQLLRFSVSDTGIGIDAERVSTLFQAFEQADSSITRLYGGTGLGLTICQQLVDLMGGQIGVTSEPGSGTTFWFDLPLIEALQEDVQQHLLEEEQLLKGLRLLISDPHEHYGQALKQQAESWHIETTLCPDRHQIMERLIKAAQRNQAYDLLVIEHGNENDGLTTVQSIAQHPLLQTTQCFVALRQGHLEQHPIHNNIHLCTKFANVSEWRHLFANSIRKTVQPALPTAPKIHNTLDTLQVLVVEDNDINRKVLGGMLKKLGVDYQLAENGLEAVEQIKTQHDRFSLVLMDCEMPIMDGYTATREIRNLEQRKALNHLPIVALTAHALEELRDKSLACGMDDHLTKPLQLQVLANTLQQWANPTDSPAGKRTSDAQ